MNINRWFGLLFALSCLFWASNSVVADDAVGVLRVDVGTNEVVEVEMPFEMGIGNDPSDFISGSFIGDGSIFSDRLYLFPASTNDYAFYSNGIWLDSVTESNSTMVASVGDILYLLRTDTEPFSFYLHGRIPTSFFPLANPILDDFPALSDISVDPVETNALIAMETDRPADLFFAKSETNVSIYSAWTYLGRYFNSFSFSYPLNPSLNANPDLTAFLVSDATRDTDCDGLPDAMEELIHGTSPILADTDSDGVFDSVEIAHGRNPLVFNNPSLMLFSESFEQPFVLPGYLDGQNDWKATDGAVVQTEQTCTGIAALKIESVSNEIAFASHSISNNSKQVWVDCMMTVGCYDNMNFDSDDIAYVAFSFDSFGHPVFLNGETVVTNFSISLPRDDSFHRITMCLDFPNALWDVYVDGVIVGGRLAMRGVDPSLNEVSFVGNYGYADDIVVTTERPEGLSSDGDKMPDEWELVNFGDLFRDGTSDFDSDGLIDADEYLCGASPLSPDTDGDGLPDFWEAQMGLKPSDSSDATLDLDGDGLTNTEEYFYDGDPFVVENRTLFLKEGFRDGIKALFYRSNDSITTLPDFSKLQFIESRIVTNINQQATCLEWNEAPSALIDNFAVDYTGYLYVPTNGTVVFKLTSNDGSRLTVDGEIVIDYNGTHSMQSKTGAIFLLAGLHPFRVEYFEATTEAGLVLSWQLPGAREEIIPAEYFYIPKRSGAENTDLDNDGLPDWWEKVNDLDVSDPSDSVIDSDNDGLTNAEEVAIGSNPRLKDSDGDGLSDMEESAHGSNPHKSDTDGDGLTDAIELRYGWDPNWPGETDEANAPIGPFTTFSHYADGTSALSSEHNLRSGTANNAKFTVAVDFCEPYPSDATVYGIESPGGMAQVDDMITRDPDKDFTTISTSNIIKVVTLDPKPAFTTNVAGILIVKMKCDDHATVSIGGVTVKNSWPNQEYAKAWGIIEANTINPVDIIWDSNAGGRWNLDYKCYFYPEKPRLQISCNPWIGLDRTGDPREPYISSNVVVDAIFHPQNLVSDFVSWKYSGVCNQRKEEPLSLTLWTTNRETASATYRDQEITAFCAGSKHSSTNFTVVKVDVKIGDVANEVDEVETGAFVPFEPDDINELLSSEWTNNLVDVSFLCEPADLPPEEVLEIANLGRGELYEQLEDGSLVLITKSSYPACEIENRRFKLHGHKSSINFMEEVISVIHVSSGARDETPYTVLAKPKLVPDYDRDGNINIQDESKYDLRLPLRFWVNDDEDEDSTDGKYAESPEVDIPGAKFGWLEFDGRDPDWHDSNVNGYRDLIDFTPVFMDVSMIQILPERIRNNLKFKLRHDAGVKAVWSSISKDSVALFQTGIVNNCGNNLDECSYMAKTVEVGQKGVYVPKALADLMRTPPTDKGVVFIEGCKAADTSLKLDIYYNDQKVTTGELPLHLSSVEDMYWFYSVRDAVKSQEHPLPEQYTPTNLSEFLTDKTVFFTHGFNVNEDAARAWGAEVFKRLWQSGSNAKFKMVTWAGDYHWTFGVFNGLHYQHDVYHALQSGDMYKRLVEREAPLSSHRILMAQSLGNMMTCEALRQGLVATQYFMFNAAVASEAVDGIFQNDSVTTKAKYVPSDWNDYHECSWAANWHKWFKRDPSDSRGKMGWPDYFKMALSNVVNVYNYYSTGDPVFMEDTSIPSVLTGVFHWPTLQLSWPFIDLNITVEAHCWQKQETHKGVEPIAGTLNGGWGFYWWMESNGGDEYPVRYSAATTSVMVANGSITNNPVFYYPGTQMDNRNATQDDIWYALAKYVPAVSSPVGGNSTTPAQLENHDLNDASYRNGWGRSHKIYLDNWFHSDMKDMAYFYVYPLYDELKTKGNLK